MKLTAQDIFNDVYSTRLLIFMEDRPQSNEYRQVILSPECFKKISDSIAADRKVPGSMEIVNLDLSDATYKLPDLQEINYKTKTLNDH